MKCENGDNIVDKFAGLKSKNYAFSYYDKDYEEKLEPAKLAKLVRCKGTVKATVRDNITIDTIKETVMNSALTKHDIIVLDKKCIN